jgi:hypothetical protein
VRGSLSYRLPHRRSHENANFFDRHHLRFLDKALQLAMAELRRDFTTLFARYSAYLQELATVNQTRDAIQAAKSKTS